jgi:hypothetical protein
MQEDFIRIPNNAVLCAHEIVLGLKLYYVYGIWSPFVAGSEYTVVSVPKKFREHASFKSVHSGMGDKIVFDVEGEHGIEKHFAADGNIDGHWNNNYWFKSKEDAELFCVQCLEDWKSHPDKIAEVQAERVEWQTTTRQNMRRTDHA